MIYTVTFNPAIDYVVHTDEIIPGDINRSKSEQMHCGGKGINVSLVLSELGIASKVLGFVAGFTGLAIEDEISTKGVETDFVHLKNGCSRINVKIKASVASQPADTSQNADAATDTNTFWNAGTPQNAATQPPVYIQETDLNGQGPQIPKEAIDSLYKKLDSLQDGDILVLAGSIPNTLPNDIYEKILARLAGKNIKTVVDATKDLLLNVLKYKPFLIKPNNYELGEMFGVTLSDEHEITNYAKKLKEMGAVNVLVSMAEDGAVLLDEHGSIHKCTACQGTVKNSVGAGDSMVAGFLAGLADGSSNYGYALKLGTAAGGATAFSDGLAEKEKIYKLLQQL